MIKFNTKIILFLIIIIASFLRLYGLNWDQNQHLHPDERFLTMVTNDINWPNSISEYLGENNPLSPYNNEYNFFVYGTFPVYLTKFFSGFIIFDTYEYNNITLVGRLISAIMDIGVVLLVYKISQFLFDNKTALFAAFLYSIFVLPIQLSHFYTSDTFVVFFSLISFYLLLRTIRESNKNLFLYPLSGIFLGMSLASKISTLYFIPLVFSVFFYIFLQKRYKDMLTGIFSFAIASFLTWRFFDPKTFVPGTLFKIDPRFSTNIEQLQSFNEPGSMFPPAIQWIKTTPVIFPLKNLILWGVGLPLGLLLLVSIVYLILKKSNIEINEIKKKGIRSITRIDKTDYFVLIILVWSITFFVYQGTQFTKAMRYFVILYPFIALIISTTINSLVKNKLIILVILLICAIYPLSFISIYTNPHTRIQASAWIYDNIPFGSTITCEHWDDCLPLSVNDKNYTLYRTEMLELFHPDSTEKWIKINNQLEQADYIIMSSNRLWGSIPTVPERYPLTTNYYHELLSGNSRFEIVAEFTSRPTIPLLDIELIDDYSDESFTVYDHPKVMIFRKSF